MTADATADPLAGLAGFTSAQAFISDFLGQYNLGGLATTAWNLWKDGVPLQQIMLDLRATPEYKQRFPAMEKLSKEGRAISEAQYINYEQQANSLWHAAGLPAGLLAQGDYVTKWLEGDVSINEVTHRIQDLYVRVANVAPEVRSWFQGHFMNGDASLAASFADPQNAVPVLERETAAAEFGGAGTRFGYNIDLANAYRAADVGVTAQGAEQGFQQLQTLNPLFDETVSEPQDLSAVHEGLQAVFGFGENARRILERRASERQALFGGSASAGGVQTKTGLGLGAATTTG